MRRALLALALLAPIAAKADFPDRPITIVLPYAPGSASDSYGRALGEQHPHEGLPDAANASGDDGDAPLDVHVCLLRPRWRGRCR